MKKLLLIIAVGIISMNFSFATTQVVSVQNVFFMPFSFSVNLGDTILFQYVNGFHTTTSTSVPVGASSWDELIDASHLSFIYVPAATGSYNFQCTFHAGGGMVGSFTVLCPPVTVSISSASSTTFCKPASVVLNSTVTGNPSSFQWKKGSTSLAGATLPSYTAKVSGTFKLLVTNSCGSTKLSNGIIVTANAAAVSNITPTGTVNKCAADSQLLQANTGIGLNYIWYKNNVVIAGAVGSSYTTTKAGNYKVRVTITATGCTKVSAVTKIVITCREDGTSMGADEANIYPNPAVDQFTISIPDFEAANYQLEMRDISGKLVLSENVTAQEFTFGSKIQSGIYFVELKNKNEVISRSKVIKE